MISHKGESDDSNQKRENTIHLTKMGSSEQVLSETWAGAIRDVGRWEGKQLVMLWLILLWGWNAFPYDEKPKVGRWPGKEAASREWEGTAREKKETQGQGEGGKAESMEISSVHWLGMSLALGT